MRIFCHMMMNAMDELRKYSSYKRSVINEIKNKFVQNGLKTTPQALFSLAESVIWCPQNIVGDSDTLLLGLLMSGSYTIDIMEAAGIDIRLLANESIQSVTNNFREEAVAAIDGIFSPATPIGMKIKSFSAANDVLKTSDILEAAISPVFQEGATPKDYGNGLNSELESAVDSIVESLLRDIDDEFRNTMPLGLKLNEVHCEYLSDIIERDPDTDSITFKTLVDAMNCKLKEQEYNFDSHERVLKLVQNFASLSYGTQIFLNSGGKYSSIQAALKTVAMFAPQRDSCEIMLIERNGKIQVGQYSHRGVCTTQLVSDESPIVSVQATRPLSLIPDSTIKNFETLINKSNVEEREIQSFLETNPVFLESLGYSMVHPHILLEDEETDKRLIPDFLLEKPGDLGFDILDLKLPQKKLYIKEPHLRVSEHITRAVAQLRAYAGYFDKAENRKRFIQKFGLEPFRPQLIVIIGRKQAFENNVIRKEIEDCMNNVKLLTYDDLLCYGRTRQLRLSNNFY